ncbi:MAG: hypothetical protein IBJ03_04135 [Gemmatimonadaceae bacterium]|nr:hypothetical protein [Gemmatimonadaceae bacterium]
MTSGALVDPWDMEGRRLAPLLDNVCAVVVSSTDASIAITTALSMARVQGLRRRVAVADLIGESPAIEAVLTGDDPHGIADSFLYGVSLNKIARPMLDTDNVFLMPSGTEAVDHEAVYANDRWRRLAAGFHQVGALLIVVAKPSVLGFGELCGFVGALMPVGDTAFPTPPGIPLIAAPAPPPPPPAEPSEPPKRESARRAREAAQHDSERRRTRLIAAVLVVGAVAIGVGAMWPQLLERLPSPVATLLRGSSPDTTSLVVPPTAMDSTTVDSMRNAAATSSDSAARDSVASAPLPINNPGDSTSAARFAVYFATANTRAAAMPEQRVRSLEAVALSPVMEGNELWFRLTVGANSTRAGADSLLARLRTDKVIGSGSIVSVPFALRLETRVGASIVATRIAALASRGILAYALRQGDGSASIYTGAFESPAQATALADSLRAVGVAPVLAFRTGRTF